MDLAIDWFNAQPAADNSIIYFLSDGVHNGGTFTDEAATLQAFAEINAVGITTGSSLTQLNQIDNTGGAQQITTLADLNAALNPPFLDAAITDFRVFVDGVQDTSFDTSDLTPAGTGFDINPQALSGLTTALNSQSVIVAEVEFDDGTVLTNTLTVQTPVTDTATITVTVNGENDGPVAIDDSATVTVGSTVTEDIVLNDTDIDGDDLFIQSVDDTGLLGSVIIDPTDNDQIIYDPGSAFDTLTLGQTATDTFTYVVSDGNGGSDTATVTVTIVGDNTPPDAVDDFAVLPQAESGNFDVLVNDSDPDGDAISTVSAALRDPTQGSVSVNPDGTVNFTPIDTFIDVALIDYVIQDVNGATATAVLTVIIDPNDAPTIQEPVSFEVDEGQQLAAALTGLDPENDPITWSIAGGLDGDDFTIDSVTGELSFVAVPDFSSPTDSNGDNIYFVDVQVADQFGSNTSTIRVEVLSTDPPFMAMDDLAVLPQATVGNFDVLANDSDPSGGGLDVTSVVLRDPTQGSVSINPDNTVNFTPVSTFTGTAVIDYVATDSNNFTDSAVLTVFIDPNERPQIQEPVSFDVNEVPIDAPPGTVHAPINLLASDPEGDPITWSIVGGPDQDDFTIDPNTGQLSFVNQPDFEAPTDSDGDNTYFVDVQVADFLGASAPRTIRIDAVDVQEGGPPDILSPNVPDGEVARINITILTPIVVTTVFAIDPDGDQLTYELFGEDVDLFDIDPQTGELSRLFQITDTPQSFDNDFFYELDVRVTDEAGFTDIVSLELALFTGG
ncbi:MAG: Ig-like domain-containing protein [Pseudomonadota bacterium]